MLLLRIDRKGNIQNQLVTNIIDLINQGELKFGDYLPSIRSMSDHFSISRSSVIGAYEKLASLGVVQSKERSGFFVAAIFDRELNEKAKDVLFIDNNQRPDDGKGLLEYVDDTNIPGAFMKKYFLDLHLNKTADAEHFDLKENIINTVLSLRGMKMKFSNTVVSKSATSLVFSIALAIKNHNPNPCVVLEFPCNQLIYQIFNSFNFNIKLVPVDSNGLMVEQLPNEPVDCIYVTPSYQFPTGGILNQERRAYLSEWCLKNDTWLIEDDSWAIMNLGKKITSPIYLNGQNNRFIYVTSLGLILGSETNVGIGAFPEALLDRVQDIENIVNNESSVMFSKLISDYLGSNRIIRDIANLAQKRREKYQLAIEGVNRAFDDPDVWGEPRSTYFSFNMQDVGLLKNCEILNKITLISERCDCTDYPEFKNRVIYPFASLSLDEIGRINQQLALSR